MLPPGVNQRDVDLFKETRERANSVSLLCCCIGLSFSSCFVTKKTFSILCQECYRKFYKEAGCVWENTYT